MTQCRRARSASLLGQRQPRMTQDLEDGLPVVEQLHRQGVGFGVGVTLALFAGRAQRGQCQCLWGRQRNRGRTFAGRIHRRHQAFQSTQDEHAKAPGLAVATLYQAPRLADQVRPAAQPAWIVPVGPPAVAHQPAGEALQHVFPAVPCRARRHNRGSPSATGTPRATKSGRVQATAFRRRATTCWRAPPQRARLPPGPPPRRLRGASDGSCRHLDRGPTTRPGIPESAPARAETGRPAPRSAPPNPAPPGAIR
jgi:hypothetical protein